MTEAVVPEARSRRVRLDLDSPELAATYDKVSVRQFNHGKVLIHSLRIAPGERVLDVGCGTGRLGNFVAELVEPTGQVIGLDPLPLRVALAAKKHERFSTRVGHAEDLSAFEPEQFDVVYLNSVFHWVTNKLGALREALRVLKTGGRIGVNSADADRVHQGARLVRDAVREEGLSENAGGVLGSRERVNAQQLGELLQRAGFSEVVITTHTFVDVVSGADDLFAWSSSSSFGSILSELSSSERCRVRERLAHKLESLRSPSGELRLERYLVFATARKPSAGESVSGVTPRRSVT
jgi:ubiquinone/menaquinone biosynthesis C-methylase UbiE